MSDEKKVEGRKRAEGTISIGVSAFPIQLYNKWKEDCIKSYGDCHWIKIWDDHQRARELKRYDELLQSVKVLEQEIILLKGKPKVETVKTFTEELKK